MDQVGLVHGHVRNWNTMNNVIRIGPRTGKLTALQVLRRVEKSKMTVKLVVGLAVSNLFYS